MLRKVALQKYIGVCAGWYKWCTVIFGGIGKKVSMLTWYHAIDQNKRPKIAKR